MVELTLDEKADNYRFFTENKDSMHFRRMMQNGEVEGLKKKVMELEAELKKAGEVQGATFEIMEKAVEEDECVKDAYSNLKKAHKRAEHRMLMNDNEYMLGYSEYKREVEKAYAERMSMPTKSV